MKKEVPEKTVFNRNLTFFKVQDLIQGIFKLIEDLYEDKKMTTGVPTGFGDLDKMTLGLQPGNLIVVAGRPGMGKATFCYNIAVNVSITAAKPLNTLIFTPRTPKNQVIMRMLGSVSRIDAHRIRTAQLSDSDWPKLTEGAGLISEGSLIFCDDHDIDIDILLRNSRELNEKENIKLIIIDSLEHITSTKNDNNLNEISDIARKLKAFSRELNLPIIITANLDGKLVERRDKRPVATDLRNKGALEHIADLILFLHRDSLYRNEIIRENGPLDTENCDDAEVIVNRQKNGPTGTIFLKFNRRLGLFKCL